MSDDFCKDLVDRLKMDPINSQANMLMSLASTCRDPVESSLVATAQGAYFQDAFSRESRFPGLDDYVEQARRNLSPTDFDSYQKQVLALPTFKMLEPNAALAFLGEHFDEIHDKAKDNKLTEADLQNYLKECKPSAVRTELINWMLRGINGSPGPDASRFSFLMKEVGANKGLTREDIEHVTERYNFLRMSPSFPAPYTIEDLRSLEEKFVSPYLTPTHPSSLTEFSLDRIANDPKVSEHDRDAARRFEGPEFAQLQKFSGARGDGITLSDLKAGEAHTNQILADEAAKEASRIAELKKFRD